MKASLGLLEVSGLALAINCADAMAKAASVSLAGLEKARGGGWTVIKLLGDVASVQAAIATGAALARQHQGLVSSKVIARPAEGLAVFLPTPGTPKAPSPTGTPQPGLAPVAPLAPVDAGSDTAEPESPVAGSALTLPAEQPQPGTFSQDEPPAVSDGSPEQGDSPPVTATCNLCADPACPRRKGEPHAQCIHYSK
uniref:BMC domain-containing protein n=1 Tax=Mangrovibacter yixingensis TaxID=1529639 RepID=UPI001CF9E0A1